MGGAQVGRELGLWGGGFGREWVQVRELGLWAEGCPFRAVACAVHARLLHAVATKLGCWGWELGLWAKGGHASVRCVGISWVCCLCTPLLGGLAQENEGKSPTGSEANTPCIN